MGKSFGKNISKNLSSKYSWGMLAAAKKDKYNAKTKNFDNKIIDITNLVTNTTLKSEINEVKVKSYY